MDSAKGRERVTVVAVIPARAGSRGIPSKNRQKVGGKTLIQRTIEHALESRHITRVLFTSDCPIMREMARVLGAETIVRPPELATDTAGGDAVIVHALEAIGCKPTERPDHLTVFLQPTSPFRRPGLIDECIEGIWNHSDIDCGFTVTEGHFSWYYRRVEGEPIRWMPAPLLGSIESRAPRQLIPFEERIFHENGSVYVTRTAALLKARNRITGKIAFATIRDEEAIDIDTEYDLWLANARAKWMERKSTPKKEQIVVESGVREVEFAR